MIKYAHQNKKGFTLVEVIVVSAIIVLVFGAIFSSFKYSLALINLSRAKLSAISVANDRMEYLRSLPYSEVGTIFGIPPGTVPENSTTTLNGIEFAERVRIEYIDDPADGEHPSDTNSIPSDYKKIRLEYTWEIGGVPGQIVLISNIVPRSIENTGGGTIRINVIDHNSMFLPGAKVRLINSSSTSPVDVTRITDLSGIALFSGAPVDSNYEVIVTGPIGGNAYSIDRTHAATTSNPTPVRVPFSLLADDISTQTFQISQLGDLEVVLRTGISDSKIVEEFSSLASVASSTRVMSNGTALTLNETAGVYETTGQVYLNISPVTLTRWQALRVAADTPSNTSYRAYFYTGSGTGPYSLIPNSDLPGNSSGFVDSIINISALDPITYPQIVVGLVLETGNLSVSPAIDEVGVYYRESETALAGQPFTIFGTKLIGSGIFKYNVSTTTNGSGARFLGPIESDAYQLTLSAGYDIQQSCPSYPFIKSAGLDEELEISLIANNNNSLRVSIFDTFGRPIPGIETVLTRPGYNQSRSTGGCGQVYFPGVATAQVDFELSISAAGYQSQTISGITIDGDVVMNVTLNPV